MTDKIIKKDTSAPKGTVEYSFVANKLMHVTYDGLIETGKHYTVHLELDIKDFDITNVKEADDILALGRNYELDESKTIITLPEGTKTLTSEMQKEIVEFTTEFLILNPMANAVDALYSEDTIDGAHCIMPKSDDNFGGIYHYIKETETLGSASSAYSASE